MIHTKRFSTSKKGYGGNIYEEMVDRALEKTFDHEVISKPTRYRGLARLLEAPRLFANWFRFSQLKGSFLIRTFQMALFSYKEQGLTIIYHIDASHSPMLAWLFQKLIEKIFFFRRQLDEPIVVIAEYWRDFLAQRGYRNLHLIYCGYQISDYQVSESDVLEFRGKYQLDNKKIIYIGNPQKKKGADLCYEALKDSPYTLVTSGVGDLNLPVTQLKLSFKDYVCLLKASEVVLTMSQFKEGWNRVAHEAMLVGTPVIGSGQGGMREPLVGGQQMICEDAKNLPALVEQAIGNRQQMGELGRQYAEKFPVEKFEADWQQLIQKLALDQEEKPKSRIFFDCTFTYQSGLNTGIQRVVRNIIQRAHFLNDLDPKIEWTPVICVFGRYFEITVAEVMKKKGLTPSFGLHVKKLFEFSKMTCLKLVRDHQSLHKLTYFLLCQFEWFLKRSFRGLKYMRSAVTVFRVGPAPVKITGKDHLVLLDAFWTYNVEEAIRVSAHGKPKITALIYDLIPLTHPQFVDDGTVELFQKALPSLLQIADHFICISQTVEKDVTQYCHQHSEKHFGFNHFALGSDFRMTSGHEKDIVRPEVEQFFIKSPVWLTVGTIEPRKNHSLILDAFEILWNQGSELCLLIVGRVGWKNEEIIERIFNHQEINKKLFFKSDISDVELKFCYARSRGLIFASYTEGFGLPIVEAMSSNLKVLCSDIPVFREVGKDYPIYFDLSSAQSLCNAILNSENKKSLLSIKLTDWDKSASEFFEKLM